MNYSEKADFIRKWIDEQSRPSSANPSTAANPRGLPPRPASSGNSRSVTFTPQTTFSQGKVIQEANTHWVSQSQIQNSTESETASQRGSIIKALADSVAGKTSGEKTNNNSVDLRTSNNCGNGSKPPVFVPKGFRGKLQQALLSAVDEPKKQILEEPTIAKVNGVAAASTKEQEIIPPPISTPTPVPTLAMSTTGSVAASGSHYHAIAARRTLLRSSSSSRGVYGTGSLPGIPGFGLDNSKRQNSEPLIL